MVSVQILNELATGVNSDINLLLLHIDKENAQSALLFEYDVLKKQEVNCNFLRCRAL
jgi:hypothetical protein